MSIFVDQEDGAGEGGIVLVEADGGCFFGVVVVGFVGFAG